jgi:hypothetical protein
LGEELKTIHKYPLHIADRQTVAMPRGARILTVQMQHEVPCLWAQFDADLKACRRYNKSMDKAASQWRAKHVPCTEGLPPLRVHGATGGRQ